jgi:tetratricopeptide (TPR) repeat protein
MLKILLIIITTISLQAKKSNELCKTGLALKLQGKYTLAIEKFDRSIKHKENIESYFFRANCYFKLHEFEKAVNDFTKVIEMDRLSSTSYYNRANAYIYSKKYELALVDIEKAILLEPNGADLYNNRAVIKEKLSLPYCDDYKRSCTLGDNLGCKNYNDLCKSNK